MSCCLLFRGDVVSKEINAAVNGRSNQPLFCLCASEEGRYSDSITDLLKEFNLITQWKVDSWQECGCEWAPSILVVGGKAAMWVVACFCAAILL